MSRGLTSRQRGVALIALLAVVMLGASFLVVSKLNVESNLLSAVSKNRNALVLNRAKQALIGYMAAQAAKSGENRPGAFPCPEAPGNFNDASNEGTVSYPCSLPIVGRFPWRTLGLDKLVDVSGEPLWYAIASGWAGASTVINSNCASYDASSTQTCRAGRLSIDGVTGDVVAVIIAPGPAIAVSTSTNCTAWTQTRPISGTPDWRNYLECQNATNPADNTFATTGPSSSFNDQMVTITTSEILPAIEAAIAHRIEREIAPQLKAMYSGGSWSGTSASPWLPFAATFSDPSTSVTQGTSGTLQGLLPLVYSETSPGSGTACTAGASTPRCNPTLHTWSSPSMSGASVYSASCSVSGGAINCTYHYWCSLFGCAAGTVAFNLSATVSNVGVAMRQLASSTTTTTLDSIAMTNVSSGRTLAGVLNADASATLTLSGTANYPGTGGFVSDLLCGLGWPLTLFFGCKQATVSVPTTLLQDHPITYPSDSTYGWFTRNKWHEVSYYAMASGFAPGGARSCTTGNTCLTVAYHKTATGVVDAGAQRAVVLLSGRSLTGATRPNATLSDWFEGANADGTSPFEMRSSTLLINRTFNDHVAVLDSN